MYYLNNYITIRFFQSLWTSIFDHKKFQAYIGDSIGVAISFAFA